MNAYISTNKTTAQTDEMPSIIFVLSNPPNGLTIQPTTPTNDPWSTAQTHRVDPATPATRFRARRSLFLAFASIPDPDDVAAFPTLPDELHGKWLILRQDGALFIRPRSVLRYRDRHRKHPIALPSLIRRLRSPQEYADQWKPQPDKYTLTFPQFHVDHPSE